MFQENQQIGYYTLIRFLGRGGFGEVWLAEKRNVVPPETVAIKLPQSEQLDLQGVKDEIFNWILSGKHKNILPIIECETFGNQIAIVSEYAPDGSLRDLLEKRGRLAVGDAVEVTVGILEGLAHLHHRKIIHRDLKPENILLQGRTPRLTDFGISRAVVAGNSTSVVVGTQAFMAPESFDGKRTAQTDIWAVGVIFYLLLGGRLPFPQKEITELIGAIVMREPQPLPNEVPVSIKNIVARALSKDAAQRYQSADEMLAELNGISPAAVTDRDLSPMNVVTHPLAPLNTPANNQLPTEVLTAPGKRRSKIGVIAATVFLFVAAMFGALGYGVYKLAQSVGQTQPKASETAANRASKTAANRESIEIIEPDLKPVAEFSTGLIDEAFAAVEKEYGGRVRLTSFLLYMNKGNFSHIIVTAKDLTNDEYYDSYTYYFDRQSVEKKPIKDPAFFQKIGGKWFYKEDFKWDAIPELMQKVSSKAKEIGENAEDQMIRVTRKFISFSPDTYGDVIYEISVSGVRKDIDLTADARGENVQIKVD